MPLAQDEQDDLRHHVRYLHEHVFTPKIGGMVCAHIESLLASDVIDDLITEVVDELLQIEGEHYRPGMYVVPTDPERED